MCKIELHTRQKKCCFFEHPKTLIQNRLDPQCLAGNSPTVCLKWWNYGMLFFSESCNGGCPWLWQLFSNEMIECSELSNSLCLAVIHTADMPLSSAQHCTVHHNTLQWPQLPASLKAVQGYLQFRIRVETSFALFTRQKAKFGLCSMQSILLFSRIFPETLPIIVSVLRGIWK